MTAPPDFGQQVREVAHAMKEEGVVYLLIGKGAAIIHGFPDTSQDTDIFVLKTAENTKALPAQCAGSASSLQTHRRRKSTQARTSFN